ncbi:MAG: hypothetical protein E5W30_18670, partial [Mesorhizobium sp.]
MTPKWQSSTQSQLLSIGSEPTAANQPRDGPIMPILNRAAQMQEEVAGWRRHLHQTPELNFDVFQT